MKIFFKILLALFAVDRVIASSEKCPDCGVWFACKKHDDIFSRIDDEINKNSFSRIAQKGVEK